MAKKSKVKGSAFERLVANSIISAAGEPFDRSDCYRTPLSGGHEFAGASDLVISPRLRGVFNWCVECKHRKNFRVEHCFELTGDFLSYLDQVLAACAREGNERQPLVVIRGNGGLIYAAAPGYAFHEYDQRLTLAAPHLMFWHHDVSWMLIRFSHLLGALSDKAKKKAAVAA